MESKEEIGREWREEGHGRGKGKEDPGRGGRNEIGTEKGKK